MCRILQPGYVLFTEILHFFLFPDQGWRAIGKDSSSLSFKTKHKWNSMKIYVMFSNCSWTGWMHESSHRPSCLLERRREAKSWLRANDSRNPKESWSSRLMLISAHLSLLSKLARSTAQLAQQVVSRKLRETLKLPLNRRNLRRNQPLRHPLGSHLARASAARGKALENLLQAEQNRKWNGQQDVVLNKDSTRGSACLQGNDRARQNSSKKWPCSNFKTKVYK